MSTSRCCVLSADEPGYTAHERSPGGEPTPTSFRRMRRSRPGAWQKLSRAAGRRDVPGRGPVPRCMVPWHAPLYEYVPRYPGGAAATRFFQSIKVNMVDFKNMSMDTTSSYQLNTLKVADQ